MPTDPVCGMYVAARPEALHLTRNNRTYYFCSEACLRSFADPELERARLRRRLAVAWPLSLLVLGLTYAPRVPFGVDAAGALAAVVQFYPGYEFYRGTYDAIRQRTANMDVLICVATSAAFAYSVAVLLLPGALPSTTYFDASTLIISLILTGNYLEQLTRDRAGSALLRLNALLPRRAVVVRNGTELSVPSHEVRVGDRFRVPAGGRFPADGVIRDGRTRVDESLLTGESTPVPKTAGDSVLAGSVNGEGAVEAEATGVGSDTFLAEVGRLLTDSEMSRVPLQRTADRIASVFTPVVLALAVGASVGWYLLGGAGPSTAVLIFVTVAITACPCAFGIATPAAIVVGTGRAAEEGILFRGEDAIERSARVDLVLFDKTGTLTHGTPTLAETHVAPGVATDHVLSVAAAAESGSSHPFARAVTAAARRAALAIPNAVDATTLPGIGVRAIVGGRSVEVVRPGERSADTSAGSLQEEVDRLVRRGYSTAIVREAEQPIGVLAFEDSLAPGARESIRELKESGRSVAMVTGDHPAPAELLARELGIDAVYASATPERKVAIVRRYQSEGRSVAFVGDGINDAPSLAAADVGVAIGAGTDVAREAGQVVLVGPDLEEVPRALDIARRTVRKVNGNLAWAVGYNAVLLPIAMGALVPVLGFGVYQVLPIAGAAAMAVSSTTVVMNSMSLRGTMPDRAAATQNAAPSARPS